MENRITETISKRGANYFVGLDLLRLLFIFPIIQFHLNEFIFGTASFPLGEETYFYSFFEPFARFMSFSGFGVVFLSFFLFGMKKKIDWKKIIFIMALGIFVLGNIFSKKISLNILNYEWDIYSFLLCSLFILALLQSVLGPRALLFISFPFLLIPTSLHQDLFFSLPESGSWPILPWCFLISFSYSLGKISLSYNLEKMWVKEKVFWIICILASSFSWGAYMKTPIGDDFYHFVFSRSLLEFWSHFILILFATRLCFLGFVQQKLKGSFICSFLSRLKWNRSFGICYLVHLLFLFFFSFGASFYFHHPYVFDLIFIGLFPLTEITVRGLKRITPLANIMSRTNGSR